MFESRERRLIESYKKHEKITDYTNEELYQSLEKCEEIPAVILSVICAEILRRQKIENETNKMDR